jgi:hypothetical protein
LATAVMLRGDGTPLLTNRFKNLPVFEQSETQQNKRLGFIMPDHVVYHVPQPVTGNHQPADDPMMVKAIEVLKTDFAHATSLQNESHRGE